MKFFLDTANIEEIKQGLDWGLCDGVTTNPSLVAREGREMEEAVREICELVGPERPVSAEVVAVDYEGIVAEAQERASWASNVVVKIPLIPEGVKAMKTCSDLGIPINATLIFSCGQALLAAKAGARYLSPFVGRQDDVGWDGMTVVRQIATMLRMYDALDCEIILASARHVGHVIEGTQCGAHICTMPFDVLHQLFRHPLTDVGLEKFLSDYRKLQEKLGK
ncbi:MAG: fructose-6-phosphate aldolase [Armatimonadota bacterium]